MIFQKAFAISRAARQTEDFEGASGGGSDMTKLLEAAKKKPDAGIEERLFCGRHDRILRSSRRPGVT